MSTVYEDIVKFVASNLKCSICFEIFTKPVTLVCGHNYCQKCIKEYLKNAKRDCPHCRKDESLIKHLDWLKAEIKKTEDKLSAELNSNQAYEDGIGISKNLTSSLEASTSSLYSDAAICADTNSSLASGENQEQLSQPEEGSSQELVEEDPMDSDSLLEDARLPPSAEALQYNRNSAEAAPNAEFAELSFSPHLGNRRLSFLTESRTIKTQPSQQVRTSNGRFDDCQWMADQQFTGGRFYWDVNITGSTGWAVGVALNNLKHNERLGRTSSSWCLEKSSGQLIACHNNTKTCIKHSVPKSIRVLLDMTNGQLCFQSLCENLLELHSFQVDLATPLSPVFWLYGLSSNSLSFPRPYV
ncbi:E3 ubiquitin-protein ligase RNF135 isoform X2 [Myxocyprinus asiaticus]|uniref:E3 ubiquitin-protein ligase RNF135 isoform X2 n=1 Tax=Myxocyprinus asiaticus TaxID=70543 RepID=UPI0022233501|nr:E3 ubiquitin-protein ligase RNF135 isoform X2 [Myxocyprinus asiaticus]